MICLRSTTVHLHHVHDVMITSDTLLPVASEVTCTRYLPGVEIFLFLGFKKDALLTVFHLTYLKKDVQVCTSGSYALLHSLQLHLYNARKKSY